MKIKNFALAYLVTIFSTIGSSLNINSLKSVNINGLKILNNSSVLAQKPLIVRPAPPPLSNPYLKEVDSILNTMENTHLLDFDKRPVSEADRKIAIKKVQKAEAILKQVRDSSSDDILLKQFKDRSSHFYHSSHSDDWLSLSSRICQSYVSYLDVPELALETCKTSYEFVKKYNLTEDFPFYTNIVNVYIATKKYDEAIAILEEENSLSPNDSYYLGMLGRIYYLQGKYEKAIKSYEKTVINYEKSPYELPMTYNDEISSTKSLIGWALIKQGNFSQAEKVLLEARQLQTELRLSKYSGGGVVRETFFDQGLQKVKVKQGKYEEALELAQRAKKSGFTWAGIKIKAENSSEFYYPKIAEIKQVAKEQNATIINYSIIKDPYKQQDLYMWVVHPDGKINFAEVDLNNYSQIKFNENESISDNQKKNQVLNNNYQPIILLTLAIISLGILIYLYSTKKPLKLILMSGGGIALILIALGSLLNSTQLNPSANITEFSPEEVTNAEVVDTEVTNIEEEISLASLVQRGFISAKEGERGLLSEEIVEGSCKNSDQCLRELYNLLIKPIEKYLPENPSAQVIFIPDGELFVVPFAALKNPQGRYLIEDHTIRTASSIEILQQTAQQKKSNPTATEALVVGNPIMPEIKFTGDGEFKTLESLPGTEIEAQVIAQKLNTQPLIGQDATQTIVTRKMPNANIIHLATHGFIDVHCIRDLPSGLGLGALGVTSMLALTPTGSNYDNNGCLSPSEITQLNLQAELVVLSACETGLGEIISDGVLGFARSFIDAGVPSVVVSLWSVPDAETKDLMIEFYNNLDKDIDKAQALRQAMLTTMKTHPEPVNWAGFTLVGEAQ